MVPCDEGNPKQKWFYKDGRLISKDSRACIAAGAISSHSALCFYLNVIKCNREDPRQQWTSSSSAEMAYVNAALDVELSTVPTNSSQLYACRRSS